MNPVEFLNKVGIKDCYFANSPFTKAELRKKQYSFTDRVRSTTLKELCLEIDLEVNSEENRVIATQIQKNNFVRAKSEGLSVYVFEHGGKSPYLRFYFSGSFKNKFEQREYFKAFVTKYFEVLPVGFKYDLSFYDTFHWQPLEEAEHWKYPGNTHKLVDSANTNKLNVIDEELLPKNKGVEKIPQLVSFVPTKCPFLDYALKNKLPEGNRNRDLFPNAVAALTKEQLDQLEQVQQDKIGWRNGKPKFNCKQLQKYAKEVNKTQSCETCILRREY